jgi:predicted permease
VIADFRYGLRRLARSPLFFVASVALLAIGLGANTAVYSVTRSLRERATTGVGDPEALGWIAPYDTRGRWILPLTYPELEAYREGAGVFEGIAAFRNATFVVQRDGQQPSRMQGQLVTGNYFNVLRVGMTKGRGFLPDEDQGFRTSPVVVISDDFWKEALGGDTAIVGKQITINATRFTVIGVAAPTFRGAHHRPWRSFWIPLHMVGIVSPREELYFNARRELQAVGRLAPGVTRAQASDALARVTGSLRLADSATYAQRSALFTDRFTGTGPTLETGIPRQTILFGAITGLVLLIACVNVSTMLLGRGLRRRREIAVRLALGAPRSRVIRQLLTESLILSGLATLAGLVLCVWTLAALGQWIRLPLDVTIDGQTFLFATGAAFITALGFGMLPAVASTRRANSDALRSGSDALDRRRSRLQSGFVVVQLALSMLLLMMSGIVLRTVDRSAERDPGLDASDAVMASGIDLQSMQYGPERAEAFLRELEGRVRAMPGVTSVSFSSGPAYWPESEEGMVIADEAVGNGQVAVRFAALRPGYFETVRIPILRGRDFTLADDIGAQPVAIVSGDFARKAWGDRDPIGRTIRFQGNPGRPLMVIGVAGEIHTEGADYYPLPEVYAAQRQDSKIPYTVLMLRAGGSAEMLGPAVRRIVAEMDPRLPVFPQRTLADARRSQDLELAEMGRMIGAFGALALALSALGMFTVIGFAVEQRRRDIGIQAAMGARQGQIVRRFVQQGVRLTAIGVATGAVLSFGFTRLVASFTSGLYGADAMVFVIVAALLAAPALIASWIPARRAAAVDPMVALRSD